MLFVSIGISHIVLHVTDNGVAPVRNIKSPIATHFKIARAEIRIARNQNRFNFGRLDISPVVRYLVLQNPEHSDAIA